MKLAIITSACAVLAIAGFSSTAAADGPVVSIPIERIAAGDQGTTEELIRTTVDAEFVGVECTATIEVLNGESQHPNNDIEVTSGGTTIVFPDFESMSFDSNSFVLPITLGDEIVTEVRFGDDEFMSGGFILTFDCGTPTTIPPDSTVPDTTVPETTVPDTTIPDVTTTTETPVPIETIAPTTTVEISPTSAPPTLPPATTEPPDPATPTTTEPGSGDPDPETVLPATGSNTTGLLIGTGFLLAGAAAILGSRRRTI